MKIKYVIEKDEILKTYILWEVHRNYRVDRFKGYKYECLKRMAKLNGKRV